MHLSCSCMNANACGGVSKDDSSIFLYPFDLFFNATLSHPIIIIIICIKFNNRLLELYQMDEIFTVTPINALSVQFIHCEKSNYNWWILLHSSFSLSLYPPLFISAFVCDQSWKEWFESIQLYSANGPIHFTLIGQFVTFSNSWNHHQLSTDRNNNR